MVLKWLALIIGGNLGTASFCDIVKDNVDVCAIGGEIVVRVLASST